MCKVVSFLAELGDTSPVLVHKQILLAYPCSADTDDLIECKVLENVVKVNATGRHELELWEYRSEGLQGLESAVCTSREELYHRKVVTKGVCDIGRCAGTWAVSYAVAECALSNLIRERWGNDELSTSVDCTCALLTIENSTSTNNDIRALLYHRCNRICSSCCTEGNLSHRKMTSLKSLRKRNGILNVIDNYDWTNLNLGKLLHEIFLCHIKSPLNIIKPEGISGFVNAYSSYYI